MDAGCSPLRVFAANPSDQVTQALIDLGAPCPLPRFPAPERCEARTLPLRIVSGWTTWAAPSKLGQSPVMQTSSARSQPNNRRRDGAPLKAMLS